jgi:hypothetical protein
MNPTLADLNTKELLAARRAVRNEERMLEREGELKDGFEVRTLVACRLVEGGNSVAIRASVAELSNELRCRPHVPGKAEARKIRQLMSKTGWSEEQLRKHPKFGAEIADTCNPGRRKISPEQAKRLLPHLGRKAIGRSYKIVKP